MRKLRKTPLTFRKELIDKNTQLVRLVYYPSHNGTVQVTAYPVLKVNEGTNTIISSDTYSSFRGLDADSLGEFNQLSKYRMNKIYGTIGVKPTYAMYTTWKNLSKDQGRFIRLLKKRNKPVCHFKTDIAIYNF